MKYIKVYELYNNPEIGDYIVRKNWASSDDPEIYNIVNFVNTHIGKLIDIKFDGWATHTYKVKYDIPEDLILVFYNKLSTSGGWASKPIEEYRIFTLTRGDIAFFSKNIKEAGAFLDSNKYNI